MPWAPSRVLACFWPHLPAAPERALIHSAALTGSPPCAQPQGCGAGQHQHSPHLQGASWSHGKRDVEQWPGVSGQGRGACVRGRHVPGSRADVARDRQSGEPSGVSWLPSKASPGTVLQSSEGSNIGPSFQVRCWHSDPYPSRGSATSLFFLLGSPSLEWVVEFILECLTESTH